MYTTLKSSSLTVNSTYLDINEKVLTLPRELASKVTIHKRAVLSSKGDNIVISTGSLEKGKIVSFDKSIIDDIKLPKELRKEIDSLLLNQEFKK